MKSIEDFIINIIPFVIGVFFLIASYNNWGWLNGLTVYRGKWSRVLNAIEGFVFIGIGIYLLIIY